MIGIRVDANAEIATGHVMRCLSIADELKRNCTGCIFITTEVFALQIIQSKGYQAIYMKSTWNKLENEIELLSNIIREHQIDKLIVDSYFVTYKYLQQIISISKIIYLDDLNLFQYPVSMLINYNIYAEMSSYANAYRDTDTKLLLGCQYAPLRNEFISIEPSFRRIVKKVFITTGGSDQFNVAGKLLAAIIDKSLFSELEFHVILGKMNSYLGYLQDLAQKRNLIFLHHDVKNMSVLMTKCDIAVSAGGSTLYELCACGIPTICFSFADNQLFGVRGFESQGLMSYAGDVRTDETEIISNLIILISSYISDFDLRKNISENMQKKVDGEGASRVVQEIINL